MDKDQAKLQAHAIQSALEQDSCDDCVSRANLISKLEILDRRYGSDFYWETRKIVDKLPSVKPQEPKWIPVSERLPEADGRYLCTYEDDIYENCVDFGSYENGEWYVDKVIAWMPLPKPYEPQKRSE